MRDHKARRIGLRACFVFTLASTLLIILNQARTSCKPLPNQRLLQPTTSCEAGVALEDILVVVSIKKDSHIDALWKAWGYRLRDTKSLEFFSLNPALPYEPFEAETKYPGVVDVQWNGTEGGVGKTMSYKTYRMFSTLLERHATRKWFVKTDDDTLVSVVMLQKVLAKYDYKQPWYMGYTWAKGVWEPIAFNSGSFYILSRGALESLHPLFNANYSIDTAPDHEDVMVAQMCEKAGIKPHNLAPQVFWSNPDQRVTEVPASKYQPFIAVHNIKNADMLVQMGATMDAFECKCCNV
jgi:hypothetical protein